MHGSRSQCNLEGGASHTYLGNGTYTTTGRSGGNAGAERDRERERKERGLGGLGMKDYTSHSINMGSGDDAPMSFINPMYLETPGVISRAGQRVRTGSKLARTSGIIDDSDEQMQFSNPMYEGEGYIGGSGGRGRGVGGGMRTGSKKVRSSGSGIIDDSDEQMHFTNPMYEEEGYTGGSGGRGRGVQISCITALIGVIGKALCIVSVYIAAMKESSSNGSNKADCRASLADNRSLSEVPLGVTCAISPLEAVALPFLLLLLLLLILLPCC